MNIIIDNIILDNVAGFEIKQSYRTLNDGIVLRMIDGTGIKQNSWTKVETVISGSGWVPDGLQNVDFRSSVVIDCIEPISITQASNVFTLPTNRRSDVTPYALAYTSTGWVNTASSLVTNTLTATTVSGATAYMGIWFPKLTVFCNSPAYNLDTSSGTFNWSITGQEV